MTLDPHALQLVSPALRPDGQPAYASMPLDVLTQRLLEVKGPRAEPPLVTHRGQRPWRLVLPAQTTEGPSSEALRQALEPLLRHRNATTPLYFSPDPALSLEEQAEAFEEQEQATLTGKTASLLLVGPMRDLPWALQQTLGLRHAVGRLSLPTLDALAAYAEKVVRAECASQQEQGQEVLLTAPRLDGATELTHDLVVAPLEKQLQTIRSSLRVHALLRENACQKSILAALSQASARALWVFGGHGCVDPCTWSEARLGELSCQDGAWVSGQSFAASAPVLENGVALLVACGGAGRRGDLYETLAETEYRPPPDAPDLQSELPRVLLANPRGPLAMVAQVDVLFLISFGDRVLALPTQPEAPGLRPVQVLAEQLARGEALSLATTGQRQERSRRLDALRRRLTQARLKGLSAEESIELSRSWVAFHNARSWVILGDPEVRLRGRARRG